MSKDKASPAPSSLGGIPFFLSYAFLVLISLFNFIVLPVVFSEESSQRWLLFLGGCALGGVATSVFIRKRASVFLHELKHSLVSGLVGNKPKKMTVHEESGKFEYLYTQRTAHMNAFIALAPYFFPLFTLPLGIISAIFATPHPLVALFFVGLGAGADAVLNIRDIGPWQSDLYEIRGGYLVGLLYVIAMNTMLFSFLTSWITGGTEGLLLLFLAYFKLLGIDL